MKATIGKIGLCLICVTSMFLSCNSDKQSNSTNDSKPFTLLEYSKSDTTPESKIKFSLKANLEMPEKSIKADYKTLRHNIITDILGEQFANETDNSLLKTYADSIYKESSIPEIIEFEGLYKPVYEEILNSKVSFFNDSILCYNRQLYIYTGGAHGMTTTQNYIYKLPEGRQISETEIFSEGSQHFINKLLRKEVDKLRNDTILPAVKDDIFNDDNITMNGNLSISSKGITYHYNPYDIAPYVYGTTEILLNKADIMPFLNKECAVYKYFNSEE